MFSSYGWYFATVLLLTQASCGDSAAGLPVKLNLLKATPGYGKGARSYGAPVTKASLFEKILKLENGKSEFDPNSKEWMALVNSGLFFNLSAEVVSSQEGNCLRALVGTSDCGKSLLVEGVELPSATLTPDIAIALPTRGMGPSLIGGLKYENKNFRGMGERVQATLSSGGVRETGLPAISVQWFDCNIADRLNDISVSYSEKRVPPPALKVKEPMPGELHVKRGAVEMRRRFSSRALSSIGSFVVEPYVSSISEGTSGAFSLLSGAKQGLSLQSMTDVSSCDFFVGVDTGTHLFFPNKPSQLYAIFNSYMKTVIPNMHEHPLIGRYIRGLGSLCNRATGDLFKFSDKRYCGVLSVLSSWGVGDGCLPVFHYSSPSALDKGEIYRTTITTSSAHRDPSSSKSRNPSIPERVKSLHAVKRFIGSKLDVFAAAEGGGLSPGVFVEAGCADCHSVETTSLKTYFECGLSLRSLTKIVCNDFACSCGMNGLKAILSIPCAGGAALDRMQFAVSMEVAP